MRSSEQQEVDDDVSNFYEVKVQKQLVKQGRLEVAENPRFIMEAKRKELERRQWQKVEPTPVKEKMKFSLLPHHHHRSESHGAAAIQLPAVEQEQQIQDVSAVSPPLERSSPSIVPKLRVFLPKLSVFVTTEWFVSSLKGFFGLRQLHTAQSSPADGQQYLRDRVGEKREHF